eukprot:Sspe_Gene.106542::Locus_84619_Transcript_1_1_Confidence_1.000_Length_763::g.106542::m.106542
MDRDYGLYAVDLEGPEFKVVGDEDTPGTAQTVYLKGNLAFVGDGSTLRVYDIVDRTNPTLLDTYNPTYGSVGKFAIDGDRLYLPTGNKNYGFEILDISNPNSIKMLYRHNGASEAVAAAVHPSVPNAVAFALPWKGVTYYIVADDGKSVTWKGVFAHSSGQGTYSVAFSPDGAYMYTTHM